MRVSHLLVPLVLAVTVPLSAQTNPGTSPFRRHQSLLHVVGYAAGGMVLGAWGGYMASQIARSDWSDTTGRGADRLRFSLGGAALGLLAGIFLGTRGTRIVFAPPAQPRLPLPTNGPITAKQIRQSSARTLSELLRELRPQWLRAEGTRVLLPNGEEPAAMGGVQVYLNGVLLGGREALDKVSINAVTKIEFMNGQAAALRYGAGAEDGAILLTTAPGS
jgi:hypothetical protein